jgi:hypothetical protein
MMFQSGRFKRLFVGIFADVFPPIASEMRRSQQSPAPFLANYVAPRGILSAAETE